MRTLIRSLALALALQPAIAAAQVPNTPQTLPANTVVGRLGVNPGPAQAIPFSRFQSAVSGPCATATAGLVPATGGGTANYLRADCTFANPTPSIANNNLLANISGGNAAATATSPSGLWNSFCSTTIGNFWVRQTSGWGCTALGFANPVWWGADPTGASDSASAINSALATGLPVRFPAGSFKVLSNIGVTLANGQACFCLSGAGSNITNINWPNASGGFTITTANNMNSFDIRGLHLTTSQANSGTAINVVGGGSSSAPWSLVDDVLMTGADFTGLGGSNYWAQGLAINNWGDINVIRTNFYGPINSTGGGLGLVFGGKVATTSYATVLNVAYSSFNFAAVGISLQNYWQGVTIFAINCNGASGGPCIQQTGSAAGTLSGLYIGGSQMNTKGNQIDLNTTVDALIIVNNISITCSSNNCVAINLGASFGSIVQGNYINTFGSPTSTTAMFSTGTVGAATGNVIQGLGVGFSVSASSGWTIALNAYSGVTTKISGGTGNNVGTAAAGNMTGVVP